VFDKMKQLYDMQKQARDMKKTVEALRVEKESQGGKLKLSMNGSFKAESLFIDESLLKPENRTTLENSLRDLISDTADEVAKAAAAQAMAMMKEGGFKLPGM
jgi:nucleoid-associated protein EbfC